jgi:hypothetical protein
MVSYRHGHSDYELEASESNQHINILCTDFLFSHLQKQNFMRPIFASENNIGVRTCYKPGTNQATYDASRVGVCAAKVARWIGNMSKLGANPGTGAHVRSDPGNERAAILQSLFSMKYIYKAGRIYDEDAHVRWLASQCEWATANAISQLNFFGVLSCIRDNPPAQWFVIV